MASSEPLSCPTIVHYVSPINGEAIHFLWPPLPASPKSYRHPDFLNLALLGKVKVAFQKGAFELDLNPEAFSRLSRKGMVTYSQTIAYTNAKGLWKVTTGCDFW